MLNDRKNIVQFDKINDMLNNDRTYLKEFCKAAVISFTSFKEDYEESMRHKKLKDLRKAGHRIKPVAQMIGVDQLIIEYEEAKKLLSDHSKTADIQKNITKVEQLCEAVIADFRHKITQL